MRILQPGVLDLQLIGENEKEAFETNKHFGLPNQLEFDDLRVLAILEPLLIGKMFVESNVNIRTCDLFYFCYLYRTMV